MHSTGGQPGDIKSDIIRSDIKRVIKSYNNCYKCTILNLSVRILNTNNTLTSDVSSFTQSCPAGRAVINGQPSNGVRVLMP